MARKKKSKRTNRTPKPPSETRSAEAATVFWMTTLLATVLGEVAGLAARLIVVLVEPLEAIVFLSNLLLLIAATTGVLCLILTPIVLRVRAVPPPLAITRFAVVASVLPIATLALILAFGQ